jgi:hypothetical protein
MKPFALTETKDARNRTMAPWETHASCRRELGEKKRIEAFHLSD